MNTVLLLLILMGLVGLLLVVFYLLDRVNSLHQQTATQTKTPKLDNSFGGLSGKTLWDAMIGVPTPGWDEDTLAPLRLRFEAVLQKHIELLFEDGQLDGREGFSMTVSCERTVPTLRGVIKSWIPHEYASAIYHCGHQRAILPAEEQGDIRQTLDQTGMMLFAAAGLPPHGLSALLMPPLQPAASIEKPEGESVAAPEGAAQDSAQVMVALAAPEQTEQVPVLTLPQGELQAASADAAAAGEAGAAGTWATQTTTTPPAPQSQS